MTAGIRVSVTQPSASASMEHTGLPFGLFRFFNMNNPVIFAGALTIFAGALFPGDGVVYIAYLVVGDEYHFADVIVHWSHSIRDLIEYEVHFTFHLMSVGNATYQLLYHLRSQPVTAILQRP